LDKPSPARIYDYLLGGYHNFEVDRIMAERVLKVLPYARLSAMINRAFLRRVVRFLMAQGIDQLLDIGSGIPTVGNVHQVAQTANPAARVVYVDIDPIAVAHSQAILNNNPNATAIHGDMRQPDQILNHPEVRRLLDFAKPMGLLLIAILHMVTDDQRVYDAVRVLRDALAPGSYLVICHPTNESSEKEAVQRAMNVGRSASDSKMRTRAEIERFFDGLELVEPGLVHTPSWRPEGPDDVFLDSPDRALGLAGIGRKP
jgi:SAM-dependent methyltransferase